MSAVAVKYRKQVQRSAFMPSGGMFHSDFSGASYTSSNYVSGEPLLIQAAWTAPVWLPQSVSHVLETDLGNPYYFLKAPMDFLVEQDEDDYVVSFPEAEISRSGESPKEAIDWLKASILDLYVLYKSESKLGPLPKRQLKVFEKYIGTMQNRAS